MSGRWPLLAVLLIMSVACREHRLTQRCRYGPERVVFNGGGSYITSVALARHRHSLLAAWTDKSGTWAQPLDNQGREKGKARRVGPPSVSIDLSSGESGFLVAMLRPGHVIWGGGTAMSRELDSLGRPRGPVVVHGRAGSFSRGISIVNARSGALVAWNDGTPSELSVMYARGTDRAVKVSSKNANGCCPSLVPVDDSFALIWGQYVLARQGSVSKVMLQDLDENGVRKGLPHHVATSTVEETWPVLSEGYDGALGMLYRDEHPEHSSPQGYFLRLDARAEPISDPVRICRYDGQTRAVMMTTGEVWVTVAVRSWSREWILGFDRFQTDGKRIGAQLHVFADHVKFTDVDAVRVGTKYLVLFAEDQPRQRIWIAQIRCW